MRQQHIIKRHTTLSSVYVCVCVCIDLPEITRMLVEPNWDWRPGNNSTPSRYIVHILHVYTVCTHIEHLRERWHRVGRAGSSHHSRATVDSSPLLLLDSPLMNLIRNIPNDYYTQLYRTGTFDGRDIIIIPSSYSIYVGVCVLTWLYLDKWLDADGVSVPSQRKSFPRKNKGGNKIVEISRQTNNSVLT